MISYIDTIQVLLSTFTVVGLAYLTSFLKLFDVQEISTLRRAIFLVMMPGMIFHRIAHRPLSYETWQPLLHATVTQASLHLLILIGSLIIPKGSRFLRFLQSVFSCAYSSSFYSYPIISILYGDNYLYIPVVASLVHFLFMHPFHTALIYKEDSGEEKTESSEHHEEDELEDGIEDGAGGPIHPIESQKVPEDNREDMENPGKNSDSGTEENYYADNLSESKTAVEENIQNEPESFSKNTESAKPKRRSFWKSILFSLISPLNICAVLGLIWSIPHWEFPIFLEKFTNYLEVSVPASGLACIGVFLWEHPFFGCNWLEVGIYLCVHFIVLPLLAILWAWVLRLDNTMATICTLISVAPASLSGYVMTINCGYGMKAASFTFFWSNLLFIPVFMLWVLAINMLHLFGN